MTTPEAGTAKVLIVPDTRGFGAQARREITTALSKIATPKVKILPDTRKFAAETRAGIQRAVASVGAPKIAVRPDTSKFTATLRADLARSTGGVAGIKIPVRPDLRGFRQALQAELATRAQLTVKVKVVPDLVGFRSALRAGTAGIPPIVVPVKANTAGLKSSLSGATNQAGGLSSALGGVGGTVGKLNAVAGAVAAIGTAALVAGGLTAKLAQELGKIGLEQANIIQASGVAFEALASQITGATSAVDTFSDAQRKAISNEFLDRLRTIARESSITLDTLTKTSQTLLSLDYTGAQAENTLLTIGNALAASGASGTELNDRLRGIVTAISQIEGAGRLLAQDLGQIQQRLPSATRTAVLNEIAESMGKIGDKTKASSAELKIARQEIRKLQEEGKISSEIAIPAILTVMQEIPGAVDRATGEAAALVRINTQTIQGAFEATADTFKQQLGEALLTTAGTLIPTLQELGDNAREIIGGFAPELGALLETFTKLISVNATGFSETLGSAFGALNVVLQALTPTLQTLAPVFGRLADTFGEHFAGAITAFTPLLDGLVTIFTQLFEIMSPIILIGVELISALVTPFLEGISALLEVLKPFIVQLVEGLKPAIGPLADLAENLATVLAESLGQALLALLPSVVELTLALVPLVPALVDILNAIVPLIPPIVLLAGTVLQLFIERWQVVANVVVPIVKGLAAVIAKVFEGIVFVINKALELILDAANQAIKVYDKVAERVPFLSKIGTIDVQSKLIVLPEFGKLPELPKAKIPGFEDPLKVNPVAPSAEDVKDSLEAGKAGDSASKAASAAKTLRSLIKQALKQAREIATRTSEKSIEQLEKQFRALLDTLKEIGNSKLIKLVREARKELLGLAKDRDRLDEKLKKATESLKDLKEEAKDFAESIKNSILGIGNVTKVGFQSFVAIKDRMTAAVMQAKEFRNSINKLSRLGLNQTALRDVIEAGPTEGLLTARSILEGGAAGIAQLNTLQVQLDEIANKTAKDGQDTFFNAGIRTAQGLVKGLQSQRDAIAAEMDAIADLMYSRLRKRLKIRSPSEVLAEKVGEPSGMGIVKGLRSTTSAMQQATEDVTSSLMQGARAGSSRGGGGGTTVIEIHASGPTLQDIIAVKIREADRRATARTASRSRTGTTAGSGAISQ